jgi:hypothetical protein
MTVLVVITIIFLEGISNFLHVFVTFLDFATSQVVTSQELTDQLFILFVA